MDEMIMENMFTTEDEEFNRKMVNNALNFNKEIFVPDRRGGKMQMNSEYKSIMFQNRNYDFSSKILEEFSRKWGLSE